MSVEIYCRLCAVKTEKCVNIYEEEGEKLNLAAKIIQCLQIWLYPEDILPKTVCATCCSKVNLFFDFFQVCSQAQISLMSMFKEKQEDKEIVDSHIEELNHESNFDDKDYGDSGDIEIIEESLEYTDLAVPDKSMSKRKLRTPIKRLTVDESNETQTKFELNLMDPSLEQIEIKDRKCKKVPSVSDSTPGDEEEEEFESGDEEEERKTTGRMMNGYVWKCTDCSQELNTLAELRKHHWEIHSQAPVFACMFCSKSYTRYRSFARHIKMHKDPKKFSCDICGKCFSQKTVLQSHAAVHSEERPHCCTQCGKCFKQFSSLYLHSKSHLPEQAKPKFSCSQCPKEFLSKHTLETHLKIHTGERNFVCELCGKRFIAKGSLDYHIMTHNDAKPHVCSICSKGFKTARLLTKHASLHTGIKPHQCDVCGKQFRERGALREHNRIHTGAMPYSCQFCGKLFRFKGILTVHIRQHTGERPYSCSECRREFTNWANYNKHMKRRHRNSEHSTMLVSRVAQSTELSTPVTDSIAVPPTQLVMHSPPPPPHYNPADTSTFKVVDDDMYRTPNYMGYYMPPLQHSVLQTRNQ